MNAPRVCFQHHRFGIRRLSAVPNRRGVLRSPASRLRAKLHEAIYALDMLLRSAPATTAKRNLAARERTRRLYQARIDLGLCVRPGCGLPPEPNRRECAHHRELNRLQCKEQHRLRKERKRGES